VAIVSSDETIKAAAARAFDGAPLEWSVELHERPPDDADVIVSGSDEAVVADVHFDEAAPEKALAEVFELARVRTAGRVAVVGAGGGVGATSVALHLARSMASYESTCVIDLDHRWGMADRLHIDPDALTWSSVQGKQDGIRLAALPVAGGFRVLLAPKEEAGESQVLELLQVAAREFARVVVDVGPSSFLDTVVEVSDVAVVVCAPTIVGARRARAVLDRITSTRRAVVVNRTGPGGEASRLDLKRIMGCSSYLELATSRGLRDSEDAGRLVTSRWSPWLRSVDRLARLILE
jgi:Flp pilus assembly CpaE family ATPase